MDIIDPDSQGVREIPPGPVADAIDHFLEHPETGVRIERPPHRGEFTVSPAYADLLRRVGADSAAIEVIVAEEGEQ